MDLRVSDIRQYLYCARIPHYYYVRPVQRKISFMMSRGQEQHDIMERLELRRTLKRYGLIEGERLFRVPLSSQTLRLSGICDLVVRTNHEDIPCEFKSSSSPQWSSHRYQLAAYGLLLEEKFGRPVRRGFIAWIPRGKILEVSISDGVRRYLRGIVGVIRHEINRQAFPPPTIHRGRCRDCEFRLHCSDIS